MKLSLLVVGVALGCACASAQSIVVPAGMDTTNPGTTTLAWRNSLFRFQMLYDQSHFLSQGINFPIVINRLQYRAGGAVTSVGGDVYSGVTVQMSTAPAGEGLSLVMTVADTGRGISDADKVRLFEEFEQADDTTATTHGGSGLGLSIARALTRRLGGDIALADNAGGGCLFTVTVPVQKAGPRLAVENPAPSGAGRFDLGEILVAEDHDTTAFVIREALIAAGWRVECVPDATAAAERLAVRRYQAVLSDVHMPGGGGEAVLRAARFGPGQNSRIPILALTADATAERREAYEKLGFSGLIQKPVRPRALVAALADTLLNTSREKQAKAV